MTYYSNPPAHCANCGRPAREDYAYSSTICEQWPLCEKSASPAQLALLDYLYSGEEEEEGESLEDYATRALSSLNQHYGAPREQKQERGETI